MRTVMPLVTAQHGIRSEIGPTFTKHIFILTLLRHIEHRCCCILLVYSVGVVYRLRRPTSTVDVSFIR